MSIQILPPGVAAKIAAGEVVERPASVVKELVENSLDAGATQVSIEVEGGGLRLIRVSDNGSGIPSQEVALAFARHATSKITSLEDLSRLTTLGFRGEALPSIAAVAEVTLLTRFVAEEAGIYVALREGQIVNQGRRGSPPGTTVTVRHLFRNVPARLKFLKSPTTEGGHLSHLVSQYCLAFPEVRFTLNIDGRATLSTAGNGRITEVLAQLYGLEVAQALLSIKEDPEASLSVTGFVSPPSLSRANRSYLSLFVNRRWIQSRLLSYAVEEAYQGLLMVGRHPLAVLYVTSPPDQVDVNVHPSKREVKFRDERGVFTAVQKAVRRTLVEESPAPFLRSPMGAGTAWAPAPRKAPSPEERPLPLAVPSLPEVPAQAVPARKALPILRVVGQVGGTYLVAEGPNGMYLIDQHTAHERVLFEKIRKEHQGSGLEVQGLLEPLALPLTPRQEALLQEQGPRLKEYGFDLEPFGQRTCLVRAVPALLRRQNLQETLLELLDSLQEGSGNDWSERIAVSLACHSAVRAGQTLSPEEMIELVRQLEGTSSPHTCPHGRPTLLHLSAAQLEKEFGRR